MLKCLEDKTKIHKKKKTLICVVFLYVVLLLIDLLWAARWRSG